jgi:hypothetical protein
VTSRVGAVLGLALAAVVVGGCGKSTPDDLNRTSSTAPCPGGQTRCDTGCVDLGTNSAHCGSCSHQCATGSACLGGQCVCQSGLLECSGQCTNTDSDPENCGACGNVCEYGEVCAVGACMAECPLGLEQCGRSCVDLAVDLFHCGRCDNACPGGQICEAGSCGCPAGQTACNSSCVDTQNDPSNCGGCAVQCSAGQVCSAGSCVDGDGGTAAVGDPWADAEAAAREAQQDLVGDIIFSVPSGTFEGQLAVSLSTGLTGVEIHYTIDGSLPTSSSPTYDGTALVFDGTTQLRAQAFLGSEPAGAPGTALYVARSFDIDLDLPIILLDNYGAGELDPNNRVHVDAAFMAFGLEGGFASLSATPTVATRAAFHVRGQSTAMFEKVPYRVEFRGNRDDDGDGQDDDLDWPLLGLPAESDWALRGPFADKALIRDPFFYSLGRDMGMQAPRWAFAEFYINVESRPLSPDDYQGVYIVVETIKNCRNRLDLSQLREDDTDPSLLPGGYIFKFEWLAAEEPVLEGDCGGGLDTPCWSELEVVDPNPLNSAQRAWLTDHIQGFHDLLHAANYADPVSGYSSLIDVDSFVDQLIINELGREMDSYIRSAVFYKDRDTKIFAGPLWDYNLVFGVGGAFENDQIEGWQYEQERSNMNNDWFPRLLTDPAFVDRLVTRWQQLRQGLLSQAQLDARILELASPLVNAAQRNFERWPNLNDSRVEMFTTPATSTWEGQIEYLREWLMQRVAWLDSQWQ